MHRRQVVWHAQVSVSGVIHNGVASRKSERRSRAKMRLISAPLRILGTRSGAVLLMVMCAAHRGTETRITIRNEETGNARKDAFSSKAPWCLARAGGNKPCRTPVQICPESHPKYEKWTRANHGDVCRTSWHGDPNHNPRWGDWKCPSGCTFLPHPPYCSLGQAGTTPCRYILN